MPLQSLFEWLTYGMLVPWALIAFAPNWRVTKIAVQTVFLPGILSALYAWMFIVGLNSVGENAAAESMPLMENIRANFNNDHILLAAWIHYLVFDLMVGLWIVGDARRYGVYRILIWPSLALTYAAGPIGLLIYLATRLFFTREISFMDAPDGAKHEAQA